MEDGFFAAFSRTGEGDGDAFSCRWLLLLLPSWMLLLSGGCRVGGGGAQGRRRW